MNTPREPVCVALYHYLPTCDLRALSDQTTEVIETLDAREETPLSDCLGQGVLLDLQDYLDREIITRFERVTR